MGLSVTAKKSVDFELPEEGQHFAVCVAVIDLGLHTPDKGYQGAEPQQAHKLFLCWELVDTPTRIVVGKDFTASLGKKAKLNEWIKAWRGKAVEVGETFSLAKLIKQKCVLLIEHKTSGDRVFSNIAQLIQCRKTDVVKAPERDPVIFDLDDGKEFHGPDWMPYLYGRPIEDWIAAREEKKERAKGEPSAADEEQQTETNEADIPF
jgi:hypothetical protein